MRDDSIDLMSGCEAECCDVGSAEVKLPTSGIYTIQLQHMHASYTGMRGPGLVRPNTLFRHDLQASIGIEETIGLSEPETPCRSIADGQNGYWRGSRDEVSRLDSWEQQHLNSDQVLESVERQMWQPFNCSLARLSTQDVQKLLDGVTVSFIGTSRQRSVSQALVEAWAGDGAATNTTIQSELHRLRSAREDVTIGPVTFLWSKVEREDLDGGGVLKDQAPSFRRRATHAFCSEPQHDHLVFISLGVSEMTLAVRGMEEIESLGRYYASVLRHAVMALEHCSKRFRVLAVADLPVHCLPDFCAAGCPGANPICSHEASVDVCNPYHNASFTWPVNNNRLWVCKEMLRSAAQKEGVTFVDPWQLALAFPNAGPEPHLHYFGKDKSANAMTQALLRVLMSSATEGAWQPGRAVFREPRLLPRAGPLNVENHAAEEAPSQKIPQPGCQLHST